MNLEYDIRAFKNPDGSFAVRGKASAFEGGKPILHKDKTKTPVFAEVEESTHDGPKDKQDFMEWALAFAKAHNYKSQLEALIAPQLQALGLAKSDVKPVSGRVSL
jgi:hypothetical protein